MKEKTPKVGISLEMANSNWLLGHSFTIFVSSIILIPFDLSSYKKTGSHTKWSRMVKSKQNNSDNDDTKHSDFFQWQKY